MQLGLALPQYDFSLGIGSPLSWASVLETAERAERAGFDSLWLSDHLVLDLERYGGPAERFGSFEPLVTLAALARAVPRVRLGTLVLCEALRSASLLAKSLATLDHLSGGRLDIGVGAGWYEPDYEAVGMTMPGPGERIDRLRDAVEVLRGLLPGGPFTYDGRAHRANGAVNVPPALRSARDPASVRRSLGLYALTGEDDADLTRRFERLRAFSPAGVLDGMSLDRWREGRLVGTAAEIRDQVGTWEALGVETLVLGAGAVPFQVAAVDDIELLADAVRRG